MQKQAYGKQLKGWRLLDFKGNIQLGGKVVETRYCYVSSDSENIAYFSNIAHDTLLLNVTLRQHMKYYFQQSSHISVDRRVAFALIVLAGKVKQFVSFKSTGCCNSGMNH
jgi:hypothetical protein